MKSIKELADELNVSKTAISKKIDKLGLRKQLIQSDGKWLIPESAEKTIKESMANKQVGANQPQTVDTLIETLKTQLERKDKQIEDLQKLLDQEQKLRMISEQKIMALEEKKDKKKWWFKK